MPELSTLLRQRLRATEDRNPQHPDTDTLNAYIEELLSSGERQQVLQHLSMCGQCREIIALAMPETEAAHAAAEGFVAAGMRAPRRRWFTSPAFGLVGSLAATIVGVALLFRLSPSPQTSNSRRVEQPVQQANANVVPAAPRENAPAQRQGAEPSQAPLRATIPPSTANSPVQQAPSTEAMVAAVNPTRSRSASSAIQHQARPANAENKVPVVVADLRSDYINKTFLANSYEKQVPTFYGDLPQAPAPTQANMTFAAPAVVAGNSFQGSSAFQIPANPAGTNRGVLSFYSSDTGNGRTSTLSKIVDLGKRPLARRLGPLIRSGSVGRSAMFQPGMPVGEASDAVATKPEAGTEGTLAQSQAFSSRALGAAPSKAMLGGGAQYQWKVVQGKLLRSSDLSHWTEENPNGESLRFSVVSPNGSEIWAGGNDAALMHSHDGGANWERVTLGAAATGTITSIEVAGQNLLVRSSSGQSWSSQDGGKSWDLE